MARDFGGHLGSEGGSTGFMVAEVKIKGRKRRARADDTEVDGRAARLPKVVFGGMHHFAAEPGPLPHRVHAKQAQIASVTVNLKVDASGQAGGILGDEEFAFDHVGADASFINAIALDEGLLDAKAGVDQTGERFHISGEGGTNVSTVRRGSIGGFGHKRKFCLLLRIVRPRIV